jgi:hypothetical protein
VVLVTSCFRYLASAPKVHWQAGAAAPALEQESKGVSNATAKELCFATLPKKDTHTVHAHVTGIPPGGHRAERGPISGAEGACSKLDFFPRPVRTAAGLQGCETSTANFALRLMEPEARAECSLSRQLSCAAVESHCSASTHTPPPTREGLSRVYTHRSPRSQLPPCAPGCQTAHGSRYSCRSPLGSELSAPSALEPHRPV